MKILCAFSKYNYGDPTLGLGTEYVAFNRALARLGHDVAHFDTGDRKRYPNPGSLNRGLLDSVLAQRPDLLLTVQKDCEIWIETLEAIRTSTKTKTMTWTTDDSFKFKQVSQFIARHYDLITTTYDYRIASYHAKGLWNVALTQWAANADWLQEPLSFADCQHDVTFVGIKYGTRGQLIDRLRSEGIAVECFGKGWPNGPIPTEELPIIFRNSRISLNFSGAHQGRGAMRNQMKARTFEIPGAGGFLLTEDTPGLESYYHPEKEVATFSGPDSLVAQVHRFLKDPGHRDAIARAGFLRTKLEHTYDQRFEKLLGQVILSETASKFPVYLTNLSRAQSQFQRVSPAWRALRWALVRSATAIWGPERGVKAARRLTFEMSWRLLGEATFTSRGLPGRLFPTL